MKLIIDLFMLGLVHLFCPPKKEGTQEGGDFIFMDSHGNPTNNAEQSQYQFYEVPEVHDAYDFEEGGVEF